MPPRLTRIGYSRRLGAEPRVEKRISSETKNLNANRLSAATDKEHRRATLGRIRRLDHVRARLYIVDLAILAAIAAAPSSRLDEALVVTVLPFIVTVAPDGMAIVPVVPLVTVTFIDTAPPADTPFHRDHAVRCRHFADSPRQVAHLRFDRPLLVTGGVRPHAKDIVRQRRCRTRGPAVRKTGLRTHRLTTCTKRFPGCPDTIGVFGTTAIDGPGCPSVLWDARPGAVLNGR